MPSLNTGNAILSNAIAVNSTYNVGIGGAASGSHKLQVTGATNLTDALTGTSATFERCAFVLPPILAPLAPANGIYLSNSNQLTLTTDSGQRLTIDYQGNVGIATMSPAYKLDVNGTGRFSGELTANSFVPTSSTIPSNGVYLPSANTLGFSTNSTLKMTITSGGNVGIGTSPSAWVATFKPLQLGAYGGYISGRTDDNSLFIGINHYFDGTNWIYTTTNAVSQMFFSGADIVFRNNTSGTAGTATGFNERMRITSAGNVGIGTSTPVTQLSITSLTPSSSTLDAIFNITNDIDANLRIFVTGSGSSDKRAAIGPTTNTALAFQTNSTERMRITADGLNTYIGKNATGNFQLSVDGFGNYVFNNAIGGGYRNYLNYALATYMITSNAGNTGMYMSSGGSSWNVFTSDIRVKKNFEPSQGLNELLQIEAVKYHMITDEDDAPKRLGFKAQNLLPLIPEMVTTNPMALDENGKALYTITPDYLLPVLVKAIQELKAEIEAQQQQINSLINR